MQQNTLGTIAYEITNYLGNVNVVISDRKIWTGTPTSAFKACIVSRTDYFPFGMEISSRTSTTVNYRFGYQNQEKDNEVSGNGNSYTAEFWQYDSRLGRRWNVDPVVKYHESPYACFANNPIWFIDPSGADSAKVGESWFWKVEKGDSYWSIGKRTGIDCEELQSINSQKAECLKVGSLLMLSEPKQNITIENEPRGENISDFNYGTDFLQTSHLSASLRTLMLGTNILVSNIAKNHLTTEISHEWSESKKIEFMKKGGYATASILLMEFITGTGAQTRRFGANNNLTIYLRNSLTRNLAYEKWLGSTPKERAKGIYMAYSPDKGGDPDNYGLVGHFLGGTTWYFHQRGPLLDVKVSNEFNIESFNLFGRLENMVTGSYSGIKSINRPSPDSNTIVPLSTTKQIFHWTE